MTKVFKVSIYCENCGSIFSKNFGKDVKVSEVGLGNHSVYVDNSENCTHGDFCSKCNSYVTCPTCGIDSMLSIKKREPL
jgi:hypothetical protein